MTNDKKVAIQQQHIEELEQEIQRLKQENEVLILFLIIAKLTR